MTLSGAGASQLTADVSLSSAQPGAYDVVVTLPGFAVSGALSAGFTVVAPTPVVSTGPSIQGGTGTTASLGAIAGTVDGPGNVPVANTILGLPDSGPGERVRERADRSGR